MAKIQNPQNEKAETLATDNRVNQIAEQFLGVNSEIKDGLKNHKEELTSNKKSIHVDDADREKWDNAVQSVTRAAESSDLLTVTGETNATISLSTEVVSKTEAANIITSSLNGTTDGTIGKAIADTKKELNDAITDAKKELNNTIVNKTVEINAKGNNITATLNENSDVPSYTISVDGYTTSEVNALLSSKADNTSLETKADKEEFDSHTSNTDIHITEEKREIWDTAATAIQTVKRADESSDLININQSGTSVTVTLSNAIATKTDITNLENDKADKEALQQLESNLSKHTSNEGDVLHVTQAEKNIWNAGGNALQEIIEGAHIEVDGNTVGVNTSSLVADTIFTTKVNELVGEETARATQREDEIENFIKNKVEALPSVYTGDNIFYTNCYGFEYTDPSENIIFDKIEIKFAKNLDTLTEWRAPNAPEISPLEIENDICKIVVAKVKTPPPGVYEQPPASDEIEIATSSYNTNISKEVNLSQFKFSENIILEGGWNYRFYFYDKNGSLFPASVIINYVPVGDTTLKQSSVANRYLSDRYDYWGVHGPEQDNNTKVLNGLGLKLINSVQEHINDESIHFSQKEYIIVDENGNPVEITFSDRITNGTQMFSSWAMDTFIHSLPQLKNGYQMFRNCKNLTTFLGELPLLEDGTQMFFSCKLNALSAITIIDSLKNNLAPAEKSYSIHLGISEETKTDENLLLALEESGNEVNSSYNITNKNGATWTINFIINA